MPPGPILARELPLNHQRSLVVQDGPDEDGLFLLDCAVPVISPVCEHGVEAGPGIGLEGGDYLFSDVLVIYAWLHCSCSTSIRTRAFRAHDLRHPRMGRLAHRAAMSHAMAPSFSFQTRRQSSAF